MITHRITKVDPINRTGICSIDGDVSVRNGGKGYWRCSVKVRAFENSRYKSNTGRPEVCEVCGSSKRICYDHDHATGLHRGWLCDACNRALGYVKDNPVTLRALADYLER